MTAPDRNVTESVNEVRLVGRISQQPAERILPSGDAVWTFRVVVARAGATPRRVVDALECTAWTPRAQRSVRAWNAEDVVEVSGALRRRFFRTGSGSVSRCEVEMTAGRIIRRAATS